MISTKKLYKGMTKKQLEEALVGMQEQIDLIIQELADRKILQREKELSDELEEAELTRTDPSRKDRYW